ncbi:hypothetical protein FIBSPDRAFT_729399, partial [Athelia psychrophila]
AHKLVPKFIGPYLIIGDYGNESFKLELSRELAVHGLHNKFHSSLLHLHITNDYWCFPRRQLRQIVNLGNIEEWAVSHINTWKGKGSEAQFSLIWKLGDCAWMPHHEVKHLTIFGQFLEAQGITNVKKLPNRSETVAFLGSMWYSQSWSIAKDLNNIAAVKMKHREDAVKIIVAECAARKILKAEKEKNGRAHQKLPISRSTLGRSRTMLDLQTTPAMGIAHEHIKGGTWNSVTVVLPPGYVGTAILWQHNTDKSMHPFWAKRMAEEARHANKIDTDSTLIRRRCN